MNSIATNAYAINVMQVASNDVKVTDQKVSAISFLKVKVGKNLKIINIDNILYIRAQSNYSTIYLFGGQTIFTSRTLKNWSEQINNHHFLKVQSGLIINSAVLSGYKKIGKELTFYFKDNSECKCGSRTKYFKNIVGINAIDNIPQIKVTRY